LLQIFDKRLRLVTGSTAAANENEMARSTIRKPFDRSQSKPTKSAGYKMSTSRINRKRNTRHRGKRAADLVFRL
jgi:hypothetical protein